MIIDVKRSKSESVSARNSEALFRGASYNVNFREDDKINNRSPVRINEREENRRPRCTMLFSRDTNLPFSHESRQTHLSRAATPPTSLSYVTPIAKFTAMSYVTRAWCLSFSRYCSLVGSHCRPYEETGRA